MKKSWNKRRAHPSRLSDPHREIGGEKKKNHRKSMPGSGSYRAALRRKKRAKIRTHLDQGKERKPASAEGKQAHLPIFLRGKKKSSKEFFSRLGNCEIFLAAAKKELATETVQAVRKSR